MIDWNYSKEYVDILMPEYVKKALDRLQRPNRTQYDPHRCTVPIYRKRLQMAPYPDNIKLLDKTTKIMMLYYSWSVDPTILQAIDRILRVQ